MWEKPSMYCNYRWLMRVRFQKWWIFVENGKMVKRLFFGWVLKKYVIREILGVWGGGEGLMTPYCATPPPYFSLSKIFLIYSFLRVCYTYPLLWPNQIVRNYLAQIVQKPFLFFPMYLYMKIETTPKNSFVYFIVRKTIYTIKFQKMFRDNFFLFPIIYTWKNFKSLLHKIFNPLNH